eukprot:scaffold7068_cov113-Cylindrotheca_fusiformis.AAC.1
MTDSDRSSIRLDGGLIMPGTFDPDHNRIEDLLDGGDFVEPEHRNMRRSRDRYMRDLPIFKMLQWIEQQGFTRPPIED